MKPFTILNADCQIVKRKARFWLAILSLLFVCCFAPQRAFSQTFNPLISFSVSDCTLDQALEKLFAEYELNVAFSKAELSKIRIENYSCSYKSLEEVLTDLLRGTDYGYKKIGKQYVIRKTQTTEPEPNVVQPNDEKPPKETVVQKTDTIINKAADTIMIFDTTKIIRTVMRYDTVIRVERVTDTVYEVRYQGYEIRWPDFKDKGWYISPWLALGSLGLDYEYDDVVSPNALEPISAFGLGVEAGYKPDRLAVGMSLGYRSAKYSFSFDKTVTEGDYYVNDTLDCYYVVYQGQDTVFHYILDSTYVPLTTTNYAWRDVNRLDYLSVGMLASYDFLKWEHFRTFVKAGVSLDFLLASSGSYYAEDEPIQRSISREQTAPLKLAYFGGVGVALKVGDRVELVPEVFYRGMVKSVYKAEMPLGLRMHQWEFRLGLTYYF